MSAVYTVHCTPYIKAALHCVTVNDYYKIPTCLLRVSGSDGNGTVR